MTGVACLNKAIVRTQQNRCLHNRQRQIGETLNGIQKQSVKQNQK